MGSKWKRVRGGGGGGQGRRGGCCVVGFSCIASVASIVSMVHRQWYLCGWSKNDVVICIEQPNFQHMGARWYIQ